MKQPEPLVIIAGAGPVGLALALGLSFQGVRSLVLEKKPELAEHSRAPGILTRTLEILRQWRVLDAFEAVGIRLRHVEVHRADTDQPIAHLNWEILADETATPGLLLLPQHDIESLLLHEATAHGRAEVRFGHEVLSFLQDAEGVSVAVQGPDGAPYTVRGAYMVGCDGAHSVVREQLGWPLEGKTYGTKVMLSDVRLPDERNEVGSPRLAPVGQGVQAAIRIRADLWRIVATLPPDMSDEEALSAPARDRLVADLFGPGPYTPVWSSTFHIHCRTSPHFRLGRVLIAGDAAHLNSPMGGQGMNGGIQDAHNLAWKLARSVSGGDAESLLASYEAERRTAVREQIDRTTDRLTRLVLWPAPRARAAMLRMVRRAIAHPAVLRRAARRMGMLDVHYPHSPLITGSGHHLGHRAPDTEIMDSDGQFVRLYDMVGPKAVLLLFDDGTFPLWRPGQVENWVTGLGGVTVVRVLPRAAQPVSGWFWDAQGRLSEAWRAESGTAALIRPDLIVGWRADRPTEEELLRGVEVGLGIARSGLPVSQRAL